MKVYFATTSKAPLVLPAFRACETITLMPQFALQRICPTRTHIRQITFATTGDAMRLTISANPHALPTGTARAWQALLSKGRRTLTHSDLTGLVPIIGDLAHADRFHLQNADVLPIDGKLVLRTIATSANGKTAHFDIFADCDGGSMERFSFQSPAYYIDELRACATVIMRTIIWTAPALPQPA